MTDDSITVRWTGADTSPRRLRFEPRSAGGYTRIEERWSGDEWVPEGQEIVADVGLDAPAAVIVDGNPTLRGVSR